MTKNDINDINEKMTKKKQTERQRYRESGPAIKYFSISGFHYFLQLNNLVQINASIQNVS